MLLSPPHGLLTPACLSAACTDPVLQGQSGMPRTWLALTPAAVALLFPYQFCSSSLPRVVLIASYWKAAEGNDYSLPKCYKLSAELEKPTLWKTISGQLLLPSHRFPHLVALTSLRGGFGSHALLPIKCSFIPFLLSYLSWISPDNSTRQKYLSLSLQVRLSILMERSLCRGLPSSLYLFL